MAIQHHILAIPNNLHFFPYTETLNTDHVSAKNAQAEKLAQVLDVINETVGDAISDMLLVETVLHARGWSALDWNTAYSDLPNRQMKVCSCLVWY